MGARTIAAGNFPESFNANRWLCGNQVVDMLMHLFRNLVRQPTPRRNNYWNAGAEHLNQNAAAPRVVAVAIIQKQSDVRFSDQPSVLVQRQGVADECNRRV